MNDYKFIIEVLSNYRNGIGKELRHAVHTNNDKSMQYFAGALSAIDNCIDLVKSQNKL